MEVIQKRIRQAARRRMASSFLKCFGIVLLSTSLISAIGIAIPKVFPLAFLQSPQAGQAWFWSWLAGALAASLIIAVVYAWFRSGPQFDSAVELDRRFKLRERISSAMAITPQERDSAAGVALVADATRRAEVLEVADEFPVRGWRWSWLSLVPLAAVMLLACLNDRTLAPATATDEFAPEVKQQVVEAVEKTQIKLQKKVEENKEVLNPLTDALDMVNRNLEDLKSENINTQKDALFKLSNIENEIEQQRANWGTSRESRIN